MRSRLMAAALFMILVQPLAADDELCLCRFVAPVYAPFVRQVNVEGVVRVAVVLDSTGSPTVVNALQNGPLPDRTDALRRAAVEAVKQWRFCAQQGNEKKTVILTFNFKLREGPPSSTDKWAPTEISFRPPATVDITTTAFRVTQH